MTATVAMPGISSRVMEGAAERGHGAEQVEVVGARQQHLDALGPIGTGQVRRHRPRCRQSTRRRPTGVA